MGMLRVELPFRKFGNGGDECLEETIAETMIPVRIQQFGQKRGVGSYLRGAKIQYIEYVEQFPSFPLFIPLGPVAEHDALTLLEQGLQLFHAFGYRFSSILLYNS